MLELLISVLTPVLVSMGASAADVDNYVHACSGYIYAVFAVLLIVIIAMIAARFAKKGFHHVIRWNAAMAGLLAIVFIANLVCYGPLKGVLSGVLNSGSTKLSDETLSNSDAIVKELGEEGTVLAKNSGILPLSSSTTKLNVFGWDSTNPVYSGTGSVGSASSGDVSILQSLQNAGFSTNETLTKMYTDYCDARPYLDMDLQDWTLPEPTVDHYTDAIMNEAKAFSDTAVIVIGRAGGEGMDLPTDMNAVIHGTWNLADTVSAAPENYTYTNGTYTNNGDYDDFEPGQHYLELSVTEKQMVDKVCSEFDKVIVVVNSNNTMELGWVDDYKQIGAVILAPGAGASGFTALGEILNGSVNPSGRTADTYVKDLTDTPYYNNIGNFDYNNVQDIVDANVKTDTSFNGLVSYVNYVEGIYVGYKFYETAAAEGAINYDDKVQYPFGYGLSYTTFTQKIDNFTDNGDSVSFDVNVTNTGDVAGKDVVEVYYTPPYTNGGIEKSSVNLIQYGKTSSLKPGASEVLSFTLNKEDMASYDSNCLKTANGGYVLEAGDYEISIRSDSHTVLDSAAFHVDADIDYSETGRSSDGIAANNVFEDYSAGNVTYLSRADGFANYEEATAAPAAEDYAMSDETKAAVAACFYAGYDPTVYDNASDEMPVTGANNGLTLSDLTGKAYDDADWDKLLDQLTVKDMINMICLGDEQTARVDSVGKAATSDCDGTAGLSNFMTGAQGTSFGTEVLMAQTWNTELAYRMGKAMGAEFAEVGSYGWYGPAMDTHRSAFCGRNFEYYSEDGVLAGYFAAAQVSGVATNGVYAYMKHFALNDQETNRLAALMTYSNEQAIREIYLKPFELTIKNCDSTSLAVMSSYNWIGTEPSCANSNLLQTVLRDEWGFVGMVITDYDGGFGYMMADHCVRNGNDLMLGTYVGTGLNEFTDLSATSVKAMRQACKNIMYVICNSGNYTVEDPNAGGLNRMDTMFIAIDAITAVITIGLGVYITLRCFKKSKRAE